MQSGVLAIRDVGGESDRNCRVIRELVATNAHQIRRLCADVFFDSAEAEVDDADLDALSGESGVVPLVNAVSGDGFRDGCLLVRGKPVGERLRFVVACLNARRFRYCGDARRQTPAIAASANMPSSPG